MKTADDILLCVVTLCCWLGVLGMHRMKEPMQALHYLSLPATGGSVSLAIAVLIAEGVGQAFWKALLIAIVLLASNSVVAHATGRAFRLRKLGHWQPLDGDPIELVTEEKQG